jgi:hypothetical protein
MVIGIPAVEKTISKQLENLVNRKNLSARVYKNAVVVIAD